MSQLTVILTYLQNIKKANTEEAKKQFFYLLLTDLFRADPDALSIVKQMAAGAEQAVFNIPKTGRSKTGRADTQYRQVIVEFENDIKNNAKREHAEYQLQEYFAGNFNTSSESDFYLIATDCVRWNIYGVKPESYLDKPKIRAEDVQLKVVDGFTLTEANAGEFLAFIDRYLFRSEKQVPTLDTIQIDFGDSSSLFMEVFGGMKLVYDDISQEPAIQTAFREWTRFMSVAYGSFQASGEVFLVHTYLSVFAKLIAYEVLSREAEISPAHLRGALDGSIFRQYNVENFVENDFYQWVTAGPYFLRLKRYFTRIADKISEYDFTNVRSDILKGVYQRLIDLETRHALGEYYTPDWLCEKVVAHFDFARHAQILDPSCGSGSFLIAAVNRLRALHPDLPPATIAAQVAGIDIHPLSVQVAKTTLLLALGETLRDANRPVTLRVFLANSLVTPQLAALAMFGEEFDVVIDEKRYYLPTGAFDEPQLFDHVVGVADYLAQETVNEALTPIATFANIVRKTYPATTEPLIDRFYDIYKALKQAKETGRDSIWKFILQNSYKPFFLRKQFDYIIGNPPWFTYSSIRNHDYQNLLRLLATKYDLIPAKKANMPHLEIAAIFMSHVTSYLLRDGGQLAFVVPRSFLSAEHHDNTRSAAAKGFRLTGIWDLQDVFPLFNVPSCVLFAQQANVPKPAPATGLPGQTIKGRFKNHNATLTEIADRLTTTPVTWQLQKLQKSTAFALAAPNGTTPAPTMAGENPYKTLFKQGATIVPRNFYFVSLDGGNPPNWTDRVVSVRSDAANDKDAKMPWKALTLTGQVNTNYLFRKALARNIVPFGLIAPPLVLLPLRLDQNQTGTVATLLDHRQIMTNGDLQTARWFKQVDELWEKNKTESAAKMTSQDRLNFQRGLTAQDLNRRYLVLYNASAKDANALVLDRQNLDLPFLADHKAYVFETNTAEEAYFLTAFLNSNAANIAMKPFQSSGLFGARDVHKKILDVPLRRFNGNDPAHGRLAGLGRACAERVAAYVAGRQLATQDYNVGRERTAIRQLLTTELAEIDTLLAGLIG